jgi:hypothetical protein
MSETPRDPGYQDPMIRKTGSLLRLHRLNYGVEIMDVLAANKRVEPEHIRFAENADHPATTVIELWYKATLPALAARLEFARMPYAARNQWYHNEADTLLWNTAAETNRRISWWWGMRKARPPRGAWCWICGELIHGYDTAGDMSAVARAAVMTHRAGHLSPAATILTSDTGKRTA